ncbi:MAG: cobalt-precorrin-5B (C(1))-methyltransferase CbiD [Anaerovoracaceae bacterium]
MNVYRYGKNLRCGYTTGACGAAAAKAAAALLLTERLPESVELELAGERVTFSVEHPELIREGSSSLARCAVRKDAGDDADVTHGLLIEASVCRGSGAGPAGDAGLGQGQCSPSVSGGSREAPEILIRGGAGVGIVTKPGLDQPPGAAAINSGPQKMIREAVRSVCRENGFEGVLEVTISVPGGQEAAARTFNPDLGIVGGISILGSTGIVEPMSEPALIQSIQTEMRVRWLALCAGAKPGELPAPLVLVPGNYGMTFAQQGLGAKPEQIIKCSNFIGEALDSACELAVPRIILAGNLGKLVKLAGGIFNTHSRHADCRMDILMRCTVEAAARAAEVQLSPEELQGLLQELDRCVTTDGAAAVLGKAGCLESVMQIVMKKAARHVSRRVQGAAEPPEVELFMIANDMKILGNIRVIPGEESR